MAAKDTKKQHKLELGEDELEFEEGDPIVHPSHGAGRLLSIQSWAVGGVERNYYNIELINEHGTLMIPVEQAEEAGLRLAISGEGAIKKVLKKSPEELPGDHRKRQSEISDKIHSGKAVKIAEALRDLAYRERIDGLTERDSKLKSEAEDLLIGELALIPELDMTLAAERLYDMVQEAMDKHVPVEEEE